MAGLTPGLWQVVVDWSPQGAAIAGIEIARHRIERLVRADYVKGPV
jgi:hypothetical protein